MANIIDLNKVYMKMSASLKTVNPPKAKENNQCLKEGASNANKILKRINNLTPDKIIEKYNPDGIYPFDIAYAIRDMGILIAPYDFKKMGRNKILGAVVANGTKIAILYDERSSDNRKRFTLAHELAHCCLGLDSENDSEKQIHIEFRNEFNNNAKEYMANVFAGEILIPKEPLRYVINNLIDPSIHNLSTFFGVSENVMKARLKYLGYIK